MFTTKVYVTTIPSRPVYPPCLDTVGQDNGKRNVVKNRFKKPLVSYSMQGGKLHRVGKWKCGHRYNPTSR